MKIDSAQTLFIYTIKFKNYLFEPELNILLMPFATLMELYALKMKRRFIFLKA